MRAFGLHLIWMGVLFGYCMLRSVARKSDPIGIFALVFCVTAALVGFVIFRWPKKS